MSRPRFVHIFPCLPLAWLLLVLLLAACAPQRGYEAALVLADIAARDKPSRLKETTPTPIRRPLHFSVEGRSYQGDLYQPVPGSLAAILLVPGAAETGKDDPRLVAFARSLARARFTVLVPDLQSLRELKVNPGNVGELTDAFSALISRPDYAPGGRAGMLAFSYAAGPALLAAMEPSIRERVHFVFAVGGYHDLPGVLGFFTTGYFRENGRLRHLEPNEYGKWVFVLSNLHRLSEPADRRSFEAMVERKQVDLAADLSDLAADLSPEGERLYAFITNRDPARVAELIGGLPSSIQEDIEALDLAGKDLSELRARLILVHGYDDPIIPYTESIALASAVGKEQASLFLAEGLAHVDLQPGLVSRWRLWRAIDALLAERGTDPALLH
ncbi:alpha/beta hydrolase [Desulfuromonas versatilis]|uniref:Alpha/beta hydrolase n=1 Tax=Desulfuromonas versatilis TaxID=2802975 RepID=A0ABN6DW41_9BACT|nr:tannase/feruloyl esterase family alpha/beta hydrolase [Desulfuromonas versatilis]BCR04206.1 alpha/beta hydrolase [Desulfuromonas versatilis]